MRRQEPEISDYSEMFCPRNEEEQFAALAGQTAMSATAFLRPGRERLLAFHMLRVAARNCPGAAYNLANYLSAEKPNRPRRREMATEMLVTASEMAQARIRSLEIDDDSWPDSEYFVRDVGSRALTDIGARISNIGSPGEAVGYFRRAIRIFRGNSNSWICLGNMGIYFPQETGVHPVEGMECWKEAFSMGDPHSDIDGLEPDRRSIVRVMEGALRIYGPDVIEEWVETRLIPLLHLGKKGIIELKPLAMDASDLEQVTGKPWSGAATAAAEIMGQLISDHFSPEMTLPEKVTIAASLLLSFLNRSAGSEAEKRSAVGAAMALCEDFEPLYPLLGDEEWDSVGLPETAYLTTLQAKSLYTDIVSTMIESVTDHIPKIRPMDAAAAVLFYLDGGFRRGVTSMIAPQIGRMNGPIEYLPAVYVGGARPQA